MNSLRSTDANGQIVGSGTGYGDTDQYELDASGKSLGFSDPYAYGTPDPTPDLIVPGNSFSSLSLENGQFTTSTFDGIPVTLGHRGKMVDQTFGGMFGLIEAQALASRGELVSRSYSYKDHAGRVWSGLDRETARKMQEESRGELTEHNIWFVTDDSWSLDFSLFQDKQFIREPLPDNKTLREKFVERLDDKDNNGRCRKFMESVLKNLGIKKSMEDLFDQVANNGGFILVDNLVATKGVRGLSRYGSKSPHPIGIQSLSKGDNAANSNLRVQSYISTIIHELIHRANIEGHKEYGLAAFNALSRDEQEKMPLPKTSGQYESYFTSRFNEKCAFDPYRRTISN